MSLKAAKNVRHLLCTCCSCTLRRSLMHLSIHFKHVHFLRDRSLFIGGGGGGDWVKNSKKTPFFIKTPLNNAKKFLGPPYSIGELFQCPPQL